MSRLVLLLVDLRDKARALGCTDAEIVINTTPTKLRELIAAKKGKRAA